MIFGKLDFSEKVDWTNWVYSDFKRIFANQIATGCTESVAEIAEKLGVKKIPKSERQKDESQE